MRSLFLGLLWLCSLDAMAASDRSPDRSTEYKCHFAMQDGETLVHYMMSKDNYVLQLTQQMAGGFIFAKDGVSKRFINKVFECVKAEDEFLTLDARELDRVSVH